VGAGWLPIYHPVNGLGRSVLVSALFAPGVAVACFPIYLRVSPGVLDILRFGPRVRGRARIERYDLRTASVVIHLRRGRARVTDASRPEAPSVLIALPWRGGDAVAAALLNAARTPLATPQPPMEALTD